MQPRLSSSRKWTAIPKELATQIQAVFKQTFHTQIGKGAILTEGRIYPAEILMSIGYKPESGLRQFNWEISIEYRRDKDNVMKLLNLAVDAAGSLFEQFFAAENDHDFPRIWQEVDFENRKLFVQYTTVNTELEAEADKLLGIEKSEDLAQGEWDDLETAESIKARLGVDDADDDQAGGDNDDGGSTTH